MGTAINGTVARTYTNMDTSIHNNSSYIIIVLLNFGQIKDGAVFSYTNYHI